jgi:TfoX/Sxy family transcriptional regulator of competence genes
MAYDENLVNRVRKLLAHLPDVQEKKMFGSIGFMVNGKLCIGVGEYKGSAMMVRVGPEKYEAALQKDGAMPTVMRDRVMKGYISLKSESVKDSFVLEEWITMALEYNRSLQLEAK